MRSLPWLMVLMLVGCVYNKIDVDDDDDDGGDGPVMPWEEGPDTVGDGDPETDSGTIDALDTGAATEEWGGGMFLFSTVSVDDQCTDGGVTHLFLPEGHGTEAAWQYPIEIPSWESLATAQTYTIDLQDPFSSMEITASRGDSAGTMEMAGGLQEDVLADADAFPDCLVDLAISAFIYIDGPNLLHGDATLTAEVRRGETCPEFIVPCVVTLGFIGVKEAKHLR